MTAGVPGPRNAKIEAALALAVGLVGFTALLGTSQDFGMVWDEGHTVRRDRQLAAWFGKLSEARSGKDLSALFDKAALARYWPFSREEPDGHPPFYALLGLAGWSVSHPFVDPLSAYRIGPMLLAAFACAVLFHHLSRVYGRSAGVMGAFAFLYLPRTFAHAHYAHYDMPMTSLWMLAQVSLADCLEGGRKRSAVCFGLAAGLCAATKFTGWFAVAPAIVLVGGREIAASIKASIDDKPRRLSRSSSVLYLGLPLAAVVLFAVQPPWWMNPVGGVYTFLKSNLTRDVTKPIPTLYWGKVYEYALPWHNTLVLTAVATPFMVVLLGAIGLGFSLISRSWKSDGQKLEARVWGLSWLVLMVVRALPSAPGHDGVRSFLPSIASLAVLSGVGVYRIGLALYRRKLPPLHYVLIAAAWFETIAGTVSVYPYTLSYYNAAFGGLRSAEKRGFELTYYWDTMSPEFLKWLNEEAKKRTVELRFPSDLVNIPYLREWGLAPRGAPVLGLEEVREPDYVLQRRRGVYYPYDWRLDQHGAPRFRISRQGVDLLRVYSFDESFKAYQAVKDVPIPDYLNH